MKVSIKWLRKIINFTSSNEELVANLTMAGLEVDTINSVADDFSGVVVGSILSCDNHKNADKLKVCQIDVGDGEIKQIICGAKNARSGIKVAVAIIGAQLKDFKIKKAKLRGVESYGMVCSASELGINNGLFTEDGIMELPDNLNIGDDIRKVLSLDDKVLELDITPNRGDCFSILGVAREVAVFEGASIKNRQYNPLIEIDNKQVVNISEPKLCPRYLTRVIKGIDNNITSPYWLKEALLASGQKPHSLAVDVTNFVLIELGQPLHSFDLAKIVGSINVRLAKDGEQITLLNNQKAILTDDTLVIADDKKTLAIAGVMGGIDSSTNTKTVDILLESAFFTQQAIASKARAYGLHTESSLRFERGVDFNIQKQALDMATSLILEIAGGKASDIVEVVSKENLPSRDEIYLSKKIINRILGFELESNWIATKFRALGLNINKIDNGNFYITAPSFRFDISIDRDLIEELSRLYGYDKLPSHNLTFSVKTTNNTQGILTQLTTNLVARGYSEVINYSFIAKKWHEKLHPNKPAIELVNPISNELAVMRYSLVASLLQNVIDNGRYGYNNCRFFETGMCFSSIKEAGQINKIAAIITDNRFDVSWNNANIANDFYDIKADIAALLAISAADYVFEEIIDNTSNSFLHPNKSANIISDGKIIGFVGALSPALESEFNLTNVYIFEIELASFNKKAPKYKKFSSMQLATRDISILISKDISYNQVLKSIYNLAQDKLLSVELFDVYSGNNIDNDKKSLSFTIKYQDINKTLTDIEIDKNITAIIKMLIKEYNAVQR